MVRGCPAPGPALDAVTRRLARALAAGVPIVGMNLSYDLTLLDRECRRHSLRTLDAWDRLGRVLPIVDVYVLDKFVDQYRPGSRRLADMAAHYGVRLDGAHDAAHDTLAACRVAYKIAKRAHDATSRDLHRIYRDRDEHWKRETIVARFQVVGGMGLTELHWAQAKWRAEQSAGLEEYLRRTDDDARVDPWWPIRPVGQPAMEATA
jgi:DNA polymerase-3 subunit epsilon